MADIRPFRPVKLVCGIIAAEIEHFETVEEWLAGLYGAIDSRSPRLDFDCTDYYEKEMGAGLRRGFISFERLIDPERLSEIKIKTNELEEAFRRERGASARLANIDPGFLTAAALVMATAKDFSHRIPLHGGIYGHLEFLFWKSGIRRLDWTYPDFRKGGYDPYFVNVRRIYLAQLKASEP